jgi:hypothetical protein
MQQTTHTNKDIGKKNYSAQEPDIETSCRGPVMFDIRPTAQYRIRIDRGHGVIVVTSSSYAGRRD